MAVDGPVLARAGHARPARSRPRCAGCSSSATPRTPATSRRACSTWSASSTRSGAARSPTACASVGRYHASRTIVLRRRAAAARRSTRRRRSPPTASRGPASSRCCARRSIVDVRPEPPRPPGLDRRPARRHRPGHGRVVAARPPRGGRRAAAAGPGRPARLGRRARYAPTAWRAPASCPTTPTSSTSRGCARRRGASGSPRRSTRRAPRPELRRISAVSVRTTRTRPPPGCCSSAGCARAWAGSRAGCWLATAALHGRASGRRQDVELALEPTGDGGAAASPA